jgi:YD repeat-containing protein
VVQTPLNRLTKADYSTGERFEYAYDAVSNRTAMTTTSGLITYTYDAASRLTNVGDVSYTWDARGNLTSDGTFALHTHTTPPDGWCGRKASLPRWCTPTSPMACVWRNPWNLADPLSKDVTEFA